MKTAVPHLVKTQVARVNHKCFRCGGVLFKGESYDRVATPPTPDALPAVSEVSMEEAWQYVDRTWSIRKYHKGCYRKQYEG